jgi:hypothetical protein
LSRAKTAETANLDFVAALDRAYDARKDVLYDHRRIVTGQLRDPGYFLDQFCFGEFPSG